MQREIVFIAPTSSQPRYHKRVDHLKHHGNVSVFAFKRGYYNKNSFSTDVSFYSLGIIEDGKYFQRIFSFIKAIRTIRKSINIGPDCFYYAMSFDCLLIARLCGIKKGFYEIGDLRITQQKKGLLTNIEAYLLKRISGLVLTSKYFYENFYKTKAIVPKSKVFIIDNKVNNYYRGKRPLILNKSSKRIRIGLIGLLRYKVPIEYLLKYVKNRPNSHIIECYGDGPLVNLIKDYVCENIRFYGAFKNPEDLLPIYKSIDVSFVVYDYSSLNVRLAIPNKLYESAFFGVPILCGQNTALSEEAKSWKIGKTICLESMSAFENSLNKVTNNWIQESKNHCLDIPDSELIEDGEAVVSSMF
jgi:succinoglycan biosynthesis protein ExoL